MLKSTFLSADVFFIFHDFHVHKSFENQCLLATSFKWLIIFLSFHIWKTTWRNKLKNMILFIAIAGFVFMFLLFAFFGVLYYF